MPSPYRWRDQPGAAIAGVRPPFDVSAGFQFVHELGGGLPGHAEMPRQLSDGDAARGEPGEGEAVHRAITALNRLGQQLPGQKVLQWVFSRLGGRSG
jgi:hypothetical protein